ncbi:amidohydrolase [Hydrogenophaga crassostreae]|uniref:Amidohydrolase n=1 Tax=Hydrogenophaga crassostreae TaxID=1763535 RepID=A0A162YXD8_9BURK|nr:amidohydrolase family protein [Hydrogenophaga crassostreae]AOW12053.1 amidohydrolase [Hydrogenophaga crassostreae]OAD40997.1 amidohydrolase [Hydrogenophaga crassostreae]
MWFHHCNDEACCPGERNPTDVAGRKRGRLTIDLHCHALIPAVEGLVAGTPQKAAEPAMGLASMGEASIAHNNASMLPTAGPRLTRIEQRLADMDAMGVDVQVISPSPNQYYYWADLDLARKIVAVQNESIAALCAAHPDRLAGFGNVALQHPELACEQLEHAITVLGLKGVEISTSVNGLELDDPSLTPFWAKAESLGALVFIHPFGTTLGERTASHYLVNTIGQPLETTIALSRLIFGGVLEAHPKLKIVAAHGGGYLPTYLGRSDHAHAVRPEAAVNTKQKPSEQLKRIWFDSVVFDPMALRHLIERVGASQVVVGTDYPFDMGHYDIHSLVDATTGLSDEERAAILGGNAAALIGWPT